MNVNKIREDFPALSLKFNGKPVVYFDSACMSLKPVQVVRAMNEYYENYPGCAGRSSHKFGSRVTEMYQRSRETIAKFIHAKPEEIVFTRNTTEGINLVARSLGLQKGDVVVTTDKEHNSNLLPWQILKESGVRHVIVKSNSDNTFNVKEFENVMSSANKSVKLVSVVHTSNIDGCTNPVEEITKIAHDYGALVMLDSAQAVPHTPVDVKRIGADFIAFSGHKMLGPTGTGVLFGKSSALEGMKPFLVGGETVERTTYETHVFLKPPERFEAGLQNYAGMIGLAAAAEYLQKIGLDDMHRHEEELNKYITEQLSGMPVSIIGPGAEKRGGITSFNVDGMNFHEVAIMLDEFANVMVRSGQHCAHSWFSAHGIEGSVRASLYLYNTKEEADIFIDSLKKIISLK